MNNQPHMSYQECLQRMESLKLDNERLFPILKELMHIGDVGALPPAMIEHYRQAAAATALLIGLKNNNTWVDFDAIKLIAGTPKMAFRVAFSKRLANLQGIEIINA